MESTPARGSILPADLAGLPVRGFRLRLPASPRDALRLGTSLRGALGAEGRPLVCRHQGAECEDCPERERCLHGMLFAPRSLEPAGPATPPAPWRLACWPEQGMAVARFLAFGSHARELASHAERTLRIASMKGIGRLRPSLPRVLCEPVETVSDALPPQGGGNATVRIELISPLSLKRSGNILGRELDLGTLVGAVARRARMLRWLEDGPGRPPEADSWRPPLRPLAPHRSSLRQIEAWRRSERQGRRIPLPGTVGRLEFEGVEPVELAWLRVGELLGAGRGCTLGLGSWRIG